jgi:radical SAM superfamily enzyme YgiQ (UPF0313 family)
MRALLVNPWITDFAAFDLWLKPLGLLRAAAAFRSWGWEVDYLDCLDRARPQNSGAATDAAQASAGRDFTDCTDDSERKPVATTSYPRSGQPQKPPQRDAFGRGRFPKIEIEKPAAVRDVPKRYYRYGIPLDLFRGEAARFPRPDLIVVGSTMTYWYPGYSLAVRLLKEFFPKTPVILGGLYPRLCPEHARTFSGADHVHGGDINALVGLLNSLNLPAKTAGSDLELIPAYDLLSDRSALPLLTGRGCSFSCTYCAASLLEPKTERRDPANVADEIAAHVSRYGTADFAFYDNALLYRSQDHIDLILKKVIRRNLTVRFHTPNGLHARFLTGETARLMKKTGFATIRLGLETSDTGRQAMSGGKVGNADLDRALGFLEKAGYPRREIGVYILFGLPGQPLEEAEKAAGFVRSLGARACLAEYSPIPLTPDYQRLVNEGVIEADLDPLWHNNSIFYLKQKGYSLEAVRELRTRVKALNQGGGTVSNC